MGTYHRQAEKRIRRSYMGSLIISFILLFLGVNCLLMAIVRPHPRYEELSEAAVTVAQLRSETQYHGVLYYIESTDDISYCLDGDFSADEISAKLLPGTEISLKLYEDHKGEYYAEEIRLGAELLSVYDREVWQTVFLCFGAVVVICLAAELFLFRRRGIKRELAAKDIPRYM